jgi:hypothetical protein
MTDHHGGMPMEAKAEWTTATNNNNKKRNHETIPSGLEEKSTQNKAVEDEIKLTRTVEPKHEKTFKTRINFTVIPPRGTTKFSVAKKLTATRKNTTVPRHYQTTQVQCKKLPIVTSKDWCLQSKIR